MLRYVKYQNKSTIEGITGKWYLRTKSTETIDLDNLAAHMANHNSGYSKGQMKGILTDMVACVKELLFDGKSVKIDDLAIFSLGIHCKGADRPENATPANITGYSLKARGTGDLSSSERAKAKVKELDEYSI